MKYYSEVTNQVYDTEAALVKAETEILNKKKAEEAALAEKKAKREARAKEVEEAITFAIDAQKEAREKLNAFCEDYGTFHTSLKNADALLLNCINPFFMP